MQPTSPALSGMPTGKKYMGWWGTMGSLPQKNIVQYGISPFRQAPMEGAFKHWLFQGAHRLSQRAPYFIVPVGIVYGVMQWAQHKNEYYNSKAGHQAGHSA